MKRPDSGLVALTVGMVGSAAANTAWTWDHGPVRIVAGLFATALVPTSLHLWHRVPVTGRWTRAIRAVVMTYICLAAAVVNLMHASWLLVEGGEDGVLAVLLVTALEAVMVMASLARRAHPKSKPASKSKPAAVMSGAAASGGPRQETPPAPAADTPPAPVKAVKPVRDELTTELVKRIMAEEKVSERTAYRRLEKQRAAS